MFLRCFLSTFLFISIIYFSFGQLYAQEEEGEIIIISEQVGKEIDQQEREKFKLFEGIKGFQSAVYIKLPDGRYFLKITYLDENTGELKIRRIQQSEASIKNRGHYIDHFENLQARKEEEERGGEIIIISERVGEIIDQEERDKYKLFQEVKGFQSAVFIKFPDNRRILKIICQNDQTGELKIDRIPQSKESINNYRYHINHFGEIKAQQNTVSKKPGAALFWEWFGKPFGSLNLDIRIKKSSSVSLGIVHYYLLSEYEPDSRFSGWSEYEEGKDNDVSELMPNIMYYYLVGEKNSRFEIGGGFSVRPVWNKDINGDFPLAFHGVIGYRYQKRRGLLFRIGLTPSYWPDAGFSPWPWMGISFGYCL